MVQFALEAFDWMAAMSLNNSRAQFLATKADYERFVRQPFVELLIALSHTFGGTPTVFRPNRDVRFSSDKSPYKTNVSGYLQGAESMYYLDLSLDGFMAATGYYQMAKDQLQKYRLALTSDDGEALGVELREIMTRIGAQGEGLKSTPRGIPRDHPNADLLRFTSLTCAATLAQDAVFQADLAAFASELWTRARPLNAWLDRRVGPSAEAWGQ